MRKSAVHHKIQFTCFITQDDDFLEGMFPWIPDDDNRNPSIYAIFVKCFKDPNAYDANSNKIPMGMFRYFVCIRYICLLNLFHSSTIAQQATYILCM